MTVARRPHDCPTSARDRQFFLKFTNFVVFQVKTNPKSGHKPDSGYSQTTTKPSPWYKQLQTFFLFSYCTKESFEIFSKEFFKKISFIETFVLSKNFFFVLLNFLNFNFREILAKPFNKYS